MKKAAVTAVVSAFALSLCGCNAQFVQLSQSDVSSIDGTSEISTEASDTVEFIPKDTEESDKNTDIVSPYPLDYYSRTIPPQDKTLDFYTFTANPKVFSCTITDNSLTDSEKTETAAMLLAEEYIKDFSESSDKYPFRILDYQNVTVNFLEHTVDRPPLDPTVYSTANGIGDMEVSENARVIDIDAEIKFSGSFVVVNSMELDSENVWNHIPVQGMNRKYLLYRQDDIFYLWSRDVYHYERKV